MDLLEGLKYGAIGLCVILFIISTRLLSKEQNREDVRTPVLSMIKMFLGAAVFLSLFFGLTEYLTPEPITDDKLEDVIKDLWSDHNNKNASDSTLALKIARLKRLELVITYLRMDKESRKRIRIIFLTIRIVMICHWVAWSFYKVTNDNWN